MNYCKVDTVGRFEAYAGVMIGSMRYWHVSCLKFVELADFVYLA